MKKIFISLIASLALLGCDDAPENKEVRLTPTPPPVVIEINDDFDDSYTMLDVEQNYVMCLLTNGLDQDDMCEDICSDIYDAVSCDTVEDKYEELYGIGSSSPKMIVSPFKSKTVVRTSNWVYSAPSCTHSPTRASIEKGKIFKQNETCITKKQKTTYYKDGSKFTEYARDVKVSSQMKVGTGKSFVISKTPTSVEQKEDAKTAAKYSSNLSTSTKAVDSKTVVQQKDNSKATVTKTEDAKIAAKFSSNLSTSGSNSESKNNSTKTTTVEDAKTAAKFSSNLSSSTTSTTTNTTNTTEPVAVVEESSGISATDVATVAAVGAAAGVATNIKPKNTKAVTNDVKKITVVSKSSWIKSGKPYSCGTFSPSESSQPKNKSFKQSRKCKQNEKQNIKMSDGSTKTETRTVMTTQTKVAYGTKATKSNKSNKSNKSYSSSSSNKNKNNKKKY